LSKRSTFVTCLAHDLPPPSKIASWQLRGRGGKLAGAGRAAAAGSKKAGRSGRRAIMRPGRGHCHIVKLSTENN